MTDLETYPNPRHGWTCYFCGETFKKPGAARDHFGGDLGSTAACRIKAEERGLLMALRRCEDELARYREEDSDKNREMAAMQAAHRRARAAAEEKGYARGLADARALPIVFFRWHREFLPPRQPAFHFQRDPISLLICGLEVSLPRWSIGSRRNRK